MARKVVLIPGDGIGPEIVSATRRIIDATAAGIEWVEALAGEAANKTLGTPLPDETLKAIQTHGLALKGPLTTPVGEGYRSVNVELRQTLDLFANVRPVHSIPGIDCRFENVDLIVIRENTEGLYSGIEHFLTPQKDIVESIAVLTKQASERVIRYAFEYAKSHGRKKLTLVHKANILKQSGGLFLAIGHELAREYQEIEFEEKIIDATCMHLVIQPETFDVIVTTNLFGDILSDLTAGLIGGLGVAPAANIGTGTAVFEAVHGTAPDLAGSGKANPTAIILAATMMLKHIELQSEADQIEKALYSILAEGKSLTPDLGGSTNTEGFATAIIEKLP